jgi:hypothetical protein
MTAEDKLTKIRVVCRSYTKPEEKKSVSEKITKKEK